MQAYRTQINRKTRNISTPYGLFLARNSNGYSALCYRPSSVRLSARRLSVLHTGRRISQKRL